MSSGWAAMTRHNTVLLALLVSATRDGTVPARLPVARTDAWEQSAVLRHPAVNGILQLMQAGDGVEQGEDGRHHELVERPAGRASAAVAFASRRRQPHRLLTLAPGQARRLGDTRPLKRHGIDAVAPIQRLQHVDGEGAEATAAVEYQRDWLGCHARLLLAGGGFALQAVQLTNAFLCQRKQLVEPRAAERLTLGGTLHLDELALVGHDDVGIDLGVRVLS